MLKTKLASLFLISLISFSASSAVVVNGGIHGTNGSEGNSVMIGESVTGANENGKDGVSISVSNTKIKNDVYKSLCANTFLKKFISYCNN